MGQGQARFTLCHDSRCAAIRERASERAFFAMRFLASMYATRVASKTRVCRETRHRSIRSLDPDDSSLLSSLSLPPSRCLAARAFSRSFFFFPSPLPQRIMYLDSHCRRRRAARSALSSDLRVRRRKRMTSIFRKERVNRRRLLTRRLSSGGGKERSRQRRDDFRVTPAASWDI